MSVEEIKCNGEVKQEILSPSVGFLTYKRRKRFRVGESSHAQEVTPIAADEEAVPSASRQGNRKDIGWEHGKPVDGNRYHWKCKYCEFIGQSGGVTRLKKHLAGGWHVTPCSKVPRHISYAMNAHLRELKRNKLSKSKKRGREEEDIDLDENGMNSGSPDQYISPDDPGHNDLNMQAYVPFPYVKVKDFGWDHGKSINGNRYHWKCKWCNFIGRSGGVTRLKKHLAGGWNVTSCPMVPIHIANTMNKHLIELRKKRLFKSRKRDWEEENETIDETTPELRALKDNGPISSGDMTLTTGNEEQLEKASKVANNINFHQSRDYYPKSNITTTQDLVINMAKVFDTSQTSKQSARRFNQAGSRRSRAFYRRLKNAAQRSRKFTAKVVRGPNDTMQYTDICEEVDRTSRTNNHWRSMLEHILQLPDVREGGGIERSISYALRYGHPTDSNRNSSDTAEPRDKHNQLDVMDNGIHDQTTEATASKQKCQDFFAKILCSEKFVLLCNLLCESFTGVKLDKIFDFSQINKKMKTGVYGLSLELFNQDIQQMWRKFQTVGEEMAHIASSLSDMSHDFSIEQVEEELVHEACPRNCEENYQAVAMIANNSNQSVPNTISNQNQTQATHPLSKICLCKQCGTETNSDEHFLTCNECEALYHFSCVNPRSFQEEISTCRSWICITCSNERLKSLELSLNNNSKQVHDNCGVCERLDILEEKVTDNNFSNENDGLQLALLLTDNDNDSRENSIVEESESNNDEKLEASRTTLLRLCKQCGTCEDEDRRFLICGHSQCPYKYYHIRCLKTSQIASFQQQNRQCWYCPSCLCRACFQDRDDDLIVLCDGCDEAYHTYCMKPQKISIPKGQWYCLQCNVAKAKERMRRYEEWILQQHGMKDHVSRQATIEDNRSFDVLLQAIDKVISEENLTAERKEN